MKFRARFIVNFSFHYCLTLMEFENFMELIYFSSLDISVDFPNQLVTVICNPVLKNVAPSGIRSVNDCFLLNLKECHSSKS